MISLAIIGEQCVAFEKYKHAIDFESEKGKVDNILIFSTTTLANRFIRENDLIITKAKDIPADASPEGLAEDREPDMAMWRRKVSENYKKMGNLYRQLSPNEKVKKIALHYDKLSQLFSEGL